MRACGELPPNWTAFSGVHSTWRMPRAIVPSWSEAGRVYVTADNHLNNDYEPYIWVSEDYGVTFRSINAGLAGENVAFWSVQFADRRLPHSGNSITEN